MRKNVKITLYSTVDDIQAVNFEGPGDALISFGEGGTTFENLGTAVRSSVIDSLGSTDASVSFNSFSSQDGGLLASYRFGTTDRKVEVDTLGGSAANVAAFKTSLYQALSRRGESYTVGVSIGGVERCFNGYLRSADIEDYGYGVHAALTFTCASGLFYTDTVTSRTAEVPSGSTATTASAGIDLKRPTDALYTTGAVKVYSAAVSTVPSGSVYTVTGGSKTIGGFTTKASSTCSPTRPVMFYGGGKPMFIYDKTSIVTGLSSSAGDFFPVTESAKSAQLGLRFPVSAGNTYTEELLKRTWYVGVV